MSGCRRFRPAFSGRGCRRFQPAFTVSDDTACDLGKWIYGEARTACADKREYLELQIAHAPFHLEAGKVIGQVDCGEEIPEEVLVGPSSPYAIASERAVSRILRAEKRFPG